MFVFPASFGQKRLWLLDRFESGTAVYNLPLAYRMKGVLQCDALEQSLNEIIRRHESLRTTLAGHDKQVLQRIVAELKLELPLVDLTDHLDREAELRQLLDREAQQPFDLEVGPLFRARLFRIAEQEYVLALTFHHVVSDGWSMGVFFRELNSLYEAYSHGQAASLKELPIQYADFALWQRDWLQGAELERQLSYWKQRLEKLDTLELPTDRPRPKRQTFNGAHRNVFLPPELTAALKVLSLHSNVTLFMTLAAAFQALLHRYSGQDDIPVGIPIAGRNRPETTDLIGFFVNTLVLRGDLSGNPTVSELLQRVREDALGALSHQDLPFEKLVEELNPQRDLSRSPLFQVMFAWQNVPAVELNLELLTLSPEPVDCQIAKFDLSLDLMEKDTGIQGVIEYNTDLFDAGTIDRMVGHYRTLLEGIVAQPQARVSELPFLTEAEYHRIVLEWNATQTDYPKDRCVHELFETQAARTPDAIAVGFEGRTLSYQELNRRANQVAHHLRNLEVKPGTLVGICMERSQEMLVGLLGILKAGGAYVPLDPAFPRDRLTFMVENAELNLIVTSGPLKDVMPDTKCTPVCLVADRDQIRKQPTENPLPVVDPMNIAYLLYTSGSTGKPKGVEIPHLALTNFLWSMRSKPGCTERDVLLALTTLSFDIAMLELYLPLIVGGRIEMASRRVAADGRLLAERIEQCRPTLMQATPATWRMLIETGWGGAPWMTALCGGEGLPRELAAQLTRRVSRLWNMYGPTETTIWSSLEKVNMEKSEITIGRPIANTELYILDQNLHLLPPGIPGELFISGDGLARGYRNRPELTAEKFIPHPFSKSGARLYRTGDLAKYLTDGRVVHLGRLDNQVKLRGFRIELGEIETLLDQHPAVQTSVVVARDIGRGGADKILVGYVVPEPGQSPTVDELRRFLHLKLPNYMLPSTFVLMESLPLTPNGKIDRRALPPPETVRGRTPLMSRTPTPLEADLCEIWREILGLEHVGLDEDFFEIGGNSLLVVHLMVVIEERHGIKLPLELLLEAPTVARLAEKLEELTGRSRPAVLEDLTDGTERHVPPQTETERRLLAIWERLLKVHPLGIRDSFIELQEQPTLLDQMLIEIKREFGVAAEGLPVNAFMEEPTIEVLARNIDGNSKPAASQVVCLQPLGSKPPLFLIHDGGSNVFVYRALVVRMGTNRPVYCIRAKSNSDGFPFYKGGSMEEVAAGYIAEIKTVQPRGPYSLGGACIGGVIAFEMARQLRTQGEVVSDPVLLFDAYILNNPNLCREEQVGIQRRLGALAADTHWTALRRRINNQLNCASQLGLVKAVWYITGKILHNALSATTFVIRAVMRKLRAFLARVAGKFGQKSVASIEKQDAVELIRRRLTEEFMPVSLRLLDEACAKCLSRQHRPVQSRTRQRFRDVVERARTGWNGRA